MSIHLLLLTLSVCALAASAAGDGLAGITTDTRRARQMALLVTLTLSVGNAVCLLPDTPRWYSSALVALTFGGLVWVVVSRRTARRAAHRLAAAAPASAVAGVVLSRGDRAVGSSAGTPRAVPHLRVVSATPAAAVRPSTMARPHLAALPGGRAEHSGGGSEHPTVVATPVSDWDEGVHWDDAFLADYLADRPVVTKADLDRVGAPGSRAQSVEIARRVSTLAPEAGRRRARGSAFRARMHAANGAVQRDQVRAAYEDAPTVRRSRGSQA